MNDQDNTRIVQEGYSLFLQGDISNLLKLYSDDIEWITPGPTDLIPYAGTYRGLQQVQQFFAKLSEEINFEQFDPQAFIAQGDKVVVLGRSRGRITATDQRFEVDWVHVLTLRDGKVIKFQAFEDTATIAASFSQPRNRAVGV